MKTFLVANDFSKNAEHALEYAILFANKMNADIHLIWVDNTVSEEIIIDTIDRDLQREIKKQSEVLIKKYQPQLKNNKFKLLFRKGKVYQEITKAAASINAEMIFAGTHGVSGYEQYWIGSNANRIVTQAPCPVVTIRRDYPFKDEIKNILLPLDSSLETKYKLPYACKIATQLGAQVHLLVIYNTPLSIVRRRIDSVYNEAEKCMNKNKVKFVKVTLEVDNVASSIIKYADENDMDLIMIMTDQSTTTGGKFLGPYAQQLINNSFIPVMSVRAKQNI